MSIADKLTQLNKIKQDIKQAIIDKGQAATDDMGEYSALISNISGGGKVDDSFKNFIERNGEEFNLPIGVTTIGDRAFLKNTQISTLNISPTVTSIGSAAFSGCTNLALTSLPEGITKIGGSTF